MQDPAILRIKRIKGQVAGIQRMYEAQRSCLEIVQQVQAVRVALARLSVLLLSDEAKRCVEAGELKELEKIVKKTFQNV